MAAWFAPPSDILAGDLARGEYLLRAAGCASCHTDPGAKGKNPRPKGAPLAGGRPLATPYGIFFTPNITGDPVTGIGRWKFADFRRAMHDGRAPNTAPYFPAFPFTSYTGMSDRDLVDLWAYLERQAPVVQPNRPHELAFPFNLRILMHGWRALFFRQGGRDQAADTAATPEWRRGAYLVRAVGHCGECHTPRNIFGAMDHSRELAGSRLGPEGKIPNITPHPRKGIGGWSVSEIVDYLESGMLPDGDFAGGEMVDVIDNSTGRLTPADRRAIAVYLKSLPALAE